ncbi:hypothetical protein SAMN04490194_3486 [Pseudomonas migulae]|uniref:Acyltransferase family protein n=1 Tax=Pseudomonas migulae TaxID=78543 RepID=A0A1H5KTX6_9PSED|nr:hypothetical protein SAMN04490194_3486 [Pseudomonas migulae]
MVCRAVDVDFGTGTARALGLDGGPIGQMFIDKGAVGVDVFFVISGLVIFLSTEGKSLPLGRFLSWALLFRLQAPLLIVAALLFAVCQAWTGYGWISEFYRSDIVYEFLLGIAIGMTYRRGWIKPVLWLPLLALSCMALERFFENRRMYLMHVLVLSAGGFVAQRYGVNPYVMFTVCVATIGVASWASYEWVEKSSYRWLKARIDGELPDRGELALSRQKY